MGTGSTPNSGLLTSETGGGGVGGGHTVVIPVQTRFDETYVDRLSPLITPDSVNPCRFSGEDPSNRVSRGTHFIIGEDDS